MISSSVLALAACMTDYQQGADDPPYGPSTSLFRGGEGPSGGDAGTSGPTCSGGVIEAGVCPVSFKQILETFRAAQCNAASGCHGGQTDPLIDPDDPTKTWNIFASFKLSNAGGKAYINPCSTDPSQSAIACNLDPNATNCGIPMPQGAVGTYDQAKIQDIKTWLQCGSPNN